VIVVIMGVTATGKTTIAKELVRRTGWEFAEGDEYHSEANRQKMHAGIPLTDEDRQPWLESLHTVLANWFHAGKSGAMTCSALKESYRSILRGELPDGAVQFVVLEAPKSVLVDRLAHRTNHFMNPALLDSQLATLEEPSDAIHLDVNRSPTESVQKLIKELKVAG
jgi:gluconokinase